MPRSTSPHGSPRHLPNAPIALLALAVLLAGCIVPDVREPAEGAPTPPGALPSPAPAHASYPELAASPIRGLTPEQIDAYANGKGASMALPAELNGYPGPLHVLELAEPLGLTEDQRAAMDRELERMRAEAIAVGRELLALHEALDAAFRDGSLDEAKLAQLLDAIAQKDAELRRVHLGTHLGAKALLTPHQNALYAELRGYGRADHASHDH